jgi:four helix bundle protein
LAKGDDLEERLIDFAVTIINFSSNLPKTRAGIHISNQLLRSGTSPAALYGEARSAESTNDFIHKLKVCLKELNESNIWLKILSKSSMQSEDKVLVIRQECEELCRIINASIQTSRKRLASTQSPT